MRTSKLLNLGAILLVVGLAAGAFAEEASAPSGAEVADESGAEGADESETPAEPWADESAADVEEAAVAASEAAALEDDPAGDAEAAIVEAPVETPDALESLPGEAVESELGEAAESELGAIGYDSAGRPGRIHVVRVGDTLWDISDLYLGTPWVWPSIWQDNRDIENPHLIYPGDHIWITPSEMRKISKQEAEALLAGQPAAPEAEPFVEPEPVVTPSVPAVQGEDPTYFVANRPSVGLVSAEMVDAAASILENVGPRLMIGQPDRIWVGLGEGEVEPGDQFTVFRVQEKVFDPATKRMLGYHVNLLGWVEIAEVSKESSLAVVEQSSSEMAIGDRLMPRQEPVQEVAIQPSSSDVRGQISFLAHQRTTMGSLDFVYLNRGTLDGIEVGTPLEVYRQGFLKRDEVRQERLTIPERVVASLLVVRAAPEASVALIRRTEEELTLGDHFRTQ